jgi:hypothetical protein
MATNILTQARLKELLHYDPATGVFRNACQRGQRGAPGAITGCVNSRGYMQITLTGKCYRAHRLAWLYEYGVFPVADTDHIDQDKTNNRIVNLRAATRSENKQNVGLQRNNTSGYKGVVWAKHVSKWRAEIKLNRKLWHLGYFTDVVDATAAYAAAAIMFHPNRPS